MGIAVLTKWGNSVGIRIPAAELKAAHLHIGIRFNITANKDGSLTLQPIKNPQEDWLEAFNAIADAKKDKKLIEDFDNDFDKDEWRW